jgi:hypothetical protein
MSQRVPPVLSRQNTRQIALPQRAVPAMGGLPPRLVGQAGISPTTPSADDIRSTIVPDMGAKNQGGDANIILSGTYQIGTQNGVQGWTQVAHVSLDKPRPMQLYLGPVPYSPQDSTGNFRVLARINVGRGKTHTRYFCDIPIYSPVVGGVIQTAQGGGPGISLPFVAQDLDVACRITASGPGQGTILLNAQDLNNQPNATPVTPYNISAFISEADGTAPRGLYPMRRISAFINTGAPNELICSAPFGCDFASLIADPSATITWRQFDASSGAVVDNIPPNLTPTPIISTCGSLAVKNLGGAQAFAELVMYAAL